jgi:sugar-specific transcriptional regulator TrmB
MENDLIDLGFSENEAKIYLELLNRGEMLAGNISKNTRINRRTTYDSLQRLIEKGYVGFNVSANRKIFFAMNPEVIIKNLEELKERAKEIIPKLSIKQEENKVIVYQGKKGIRNILNLILDSKDYVSYGSTSHFPEVMKHDYDLFQNMKKKLKIKARTILSSSIRKTEYKKIAIPTTNFKFLSDNLTGPTSTFIFNNNVAIFIWEEPYFAVLIENKATYDSFKEYFEELWKIAKP